jgi:hypothetical protein
MLLSQGRGFLIALGLWLLAAIVASGFADVQSDSTDDRPSMTGVNPPLSRVAGYSGCAARSCHGGPTRSDAGQLPAGVKNACSLWLQHDRHHHAYQVLHSNLSEQIIRNLTGGKVAVPAYEDARCLACHVTPALAKASATEEVKQLRSEGVSCDACHTIPGQATTEWYYPHQRGQRPEGLAQCYERLGMHWLGSTRARATVCVGCHVGAPADPERGIPCREVHHDLIAAGHPRLNFEYTTYLALMPPHWRESADKNSPAPGARQPGRAVEDWYVGQLVIFAANLRLLDDQASRAEGSWPELAQQNCYSCHFNFLKNPQPGDVLSWRQKAATAQRDRLGRAAWSQLALSGPIRAWLSRHPEWQKTWSELESIMSLPRPPRKRVVTLANALAEQLDQMAAQPPQSFREPTAALTLIRGLQESWKADGLATWDEAAQVYYALQAANLQRHRFPEAPPNLPDLIDQQLQHLAKLLRLPREPHVVNSPVDYNPGQVSQCVTTLMRSIVSWYHDQGVLEKSSR